MNKNKEWNTTVKLQRYHAEKIDELVENKALSYRSRSDFVIQAVEKEIKEATLKNELTDAGKIIFEDVLRHKRLEAFQDAKIATRPISKYHTDVYETWQERDLPQEEQARNREKRRDNEMFFREQQKRSGTMRKILDTAYSDDTLIKELERGKKKKN